jgi:antitoxin CcdA
MNIRRRSTSFTIDAAKLDEARALGVNLSRAAEAGIDAALRAARVEAWQRANAEAFSNWHDYVEKHGVPLADLRKF